MSPLSGRPPGVQVRASMDGVDIQLPPRRRLASPRRSLHQAPLADRLVPSAVIFLVSLLLTTPTPLMLMATGNYTVEALALPVCLLIAAAATVVANVTDIELRVGRYEQHPAATVRLQPHLLTLDVRGRPTAEIHLDDIAQVTVDSAGPRMRIRDEIVPLLPERTDAERRWLGALLADTLERRGAGADDAAEAHAAMQRMLADRSL